MFIASKFKDYYDSAATYGIDRSVVYVRTTSEPKSIDKEAAIARDYDLTSRIKRGSSVTNLKIKASFFLVGFCGKIYPGVKLDVKKSDLTPLAVLFKYSPEELETTLLHLGCKISEARERIRWWSDYAFTARGIVNFFDKDYSYLHKVFYAERCPVFLVDQPEERFPKHHNLTLNPRLNKIAFQTVKDPHTAFQDIFMYLSGVLGTPAPEMVKISDKKLAEKRGHDGKYSFRKPPGEKKRKKNK